MPVRKNFYLHRPTEFGREASKEVRSRILAVNKKSNKLRILAGQSRPIHPSVPVKNKITNRPRITGDKKSLNFRSTETKNQNRIAAHLLKERVEPPATSFGLPNFSTQPKVPTVDARTDNLNHLFSYVNLLRYGCSKIRERKVLQASPFYRHTGYS